MSNEKRIERIESKIDEIYNEEVISLWKRIHKLENKNEALEKKVQELEDFNTPAEYKLELLRNQIDRVDKKVQELETKTASDLSQSLVAESATSEEQDCLWVARDKRTDTLYVYEVEPVEQYCETFAEDDEEEKSFRIDFDLFPEVTFENSPQKLLLESSISKMETVEKEFDRERALELLQDIESSSTKNSNASTKAILLSCAELRQMLGGSDD